ncbi:MAG: DUF6552 family protein, partial [Paracoccaceae bacterium]
GWCFVGYLWHDRSLLLLNGIAIAIFIMGILQYFFGGGHLNVHTTAQDHHVIAA